MLLTSCASIELNKEWLKDCPVTYLGDGPQLNSAVIKLAIDREYDVQRCNLDKAALRAWAKSHPKIKVK
ncbi:hypothetical protein [Xanthomonas phage SB4]|uniref:Uncharacterized protein n=1 Tax=Xanthomonas phage SB4 TaxID=3117473 RepID=A0ABZ2GY52_9CAUD